MTTRVSTVADGVTALFSVPFPYLDRSHVKVMLDGVTQPASAYSWITEGSIQMVSTPSNGVKVTIYRETPSSALTVYQSGSVLTRDQLEVDSLQALYRTEEAEGVSIRLPADHTADLLLPPLVPLAPLVVNGGASGIVMGATELTGDMALRPELAGDDGAALVTYTPPFTGAVSRGLPVKLAESVHVADFGATGDSAQDATAAFQAAVAALPANGGTIYVDPQGVYKLTAMVDYTKPILWKCERGSSDVSTNTNGGDAERPLVYWGGAGVVEALLRQRPPAVGTALWGGGSEGLVFDGFNLAEYGIHLDNARYATLLGKARHFTAAGALLSSLSGTTGVFSKKCHVKDWEYVYGTAIAAANSHGLRIIGNGSTVPSTQHKIDRIFALIKHGAALKIEETDNCQVGSAQAVGDSGTGGGGGAATGCSVWLSNVGSTVAYNNHFDYVSGEIRQESGVFGTTVNHHTAEGGLFKQVSGTPSWHARIVDASGANGPSRSDAFISHQYPLRKTYSFGANELISDSATTALFGLQWLCRTLPDAATKTIQVMIPRDAEMSDGTIEEITLLYGTNVVSAGNYRVNTKVSSVAPGNSTEVVTPEYNAGTTLAAPAQYVIGEAVIASNLPVVKGDTILVSVDRLGADALDTATTDLFVIGLRVKFRSKGPTVYDTAGIPSASMPTWNMP